MIRNALSFLVYCSFSFTVFFLSCSPLPQDPVDDPENATVSISSPNGNILLLGQKTPILIVVNIPKHIKTFNVNFGTGNSGDTIINYSNSSTSTDSLIVYGKFFVKDSNKVTVNMQLLSGFSKTVELSVLVVNVVPHFDTIPNEHSVSINTFDTLKFVASTTPKGGDVDYTAIVSPALDTGHFKTTTLQTGFQVIISSSKVDTFNIRCVAHSGLMSDTANVKWISRIIHIIPIDTGIIHLYP